jgi:hypothetical protein
MCPVLSLANRAFLALALLACLPAHATNLQFDLTGESVRLPNITPNGTIDISFVLDTSRSTVAFDFQNSPWLQSFGRGPNGPLLGTASLTNINVLLNGQLVLSRPSASASCSGERVTLPLDTPGGFFAELGTTDFGWSFDPYPGISRAALLASSDPLASLFLGFQSYPGGQVVFDGLNASVTTTVTDLGPFPASVPEPGTLGLLLLGLVGVALERMRRVIEAGERR